MKSFLSWVDLHSRDSLKMAFHNRITDSLSGNQIVIW